jgi:predicted dehydrogenase
MARQLRAGLVGGGPGAFIGPVHRIAAELDGRLRVVAGAFSSDPDRSRASAARYAVDPDRAYGSYAEMFAAEAGRADGIDLVIVAAPNHLHFPVTSDALAAGFHVVCDKPLTATLREAELLRDQVHAGDRHLAVTFTYTGYPMVRQARALCRAGELGAIRKVVVEYAQGWLGSPVEREGNKQASWRADPARSGLGGCVADIGVHAFNIAEFVSGDAVSELCAALTRVVPGRALDDDCNALLRFASGATGVLAASQVAAGERNRLELRVYGEKGGLHWSHEAPDRLRVDAADGPTRVFHAGSDYLDPSARVATRLPAGHPEGYLEAFATLYRDVAALVTGDMAVGASLVPGIDDGVRGMRFIEAAIASSAGGSAWTAIGGDSGRNVLK